jgi:hypothetical protein
VPVQFTNSALLQMLLSSGDVVADRQVVVDLFADPSTWIDSGFGITKAPLEIGYSAGVGALLAQV